MPSVATQANFPIINRHSPQARGLVLCVPLFDKGSTTQAREATKLRGNFSFNSSTISWVKNLYGSCLDMNGGYLTGDSVDLTGPDITICGFFSNRKTAGYSSFIEISGMQFCAYSDGSNSINLTLYTSSGAAATSGARLYAGYGGAAGRMFFAAMRWRASDSNLDFCFNGEWEKGLSRGLSIGAEVINIGRFPGFGAFNSNGLYMDMRVYKYLVPDSLMSKIYRNGFDLYRKPLTVVVKQPGQTYAVSGTVSGAGSGTGTLNVAQITKPHKFAIELRDKNFNLKQKLENIATDVQWEWNRFGGCGRCSFNVVGDYLKFKVSPDDDVRVYLPNADGINATLWYRGYVESAVPTLESSNKGSIKIECAGYFNWLDRIIINNSGTPKIYSSSEISLTVKDIVDNFVVPNSYIQRGTIQASNFTPDSVVFKTTAKDAIRTLYDLVGDVECGVDENLNFFWYNPSSALNYKFYIGDKLVGVSDRVDFRNILNKVYLEGGEVSGATLVSTGLSQDSIDRYGRHEEIVSNAAIVTQSVANQYIASILTQRSRPQTQLTIKLKNLNKRLEGALPIGAVSVIDHDATQAGAKWGKAINGGANKIWGTLSHGGSGQLYGGVRKEQVDRIIYTLSPENGRIHAEITCGKSLAISRASADVKRIELTQDALRQRQL